MAYWYRGKLKWRSNSLCKVLFYLHLVDKVCVYVCVCIYPKIRKHPQKSSVTENKPSGFSGADI